MATKSHGVKYAEALGKLNIGAHPLYQPVTDSQMQVGHCGYFNENGSWVPIALLTDPNDTRRSGLTTANLEAVKAPLRSETWSPIYSTSVTSNDTGLELGATVPASGVPVEGSLNFSLKAGNDFGAVLLAESPIQVDQLYAPVAPCVTWVSQNSKHLKENYHEEIGLFGLWIVTQVWTTNSAHIATLDHSKSSFDIGLSAGVTGIAKVGPSHSSSAENQAASWKSIGPEAGKRWVVSMTGHRFNFDIIHRIVFKRQLPQSSGPGKKPENGEAGTHKDEKKDKEGGKGKEDKPIGIPVEQPDGTWFADIGEGKHKEGLGRGEQEVESLQITVETAEVSSSDEVVE